MCVCAQHAFVCVRFLAWQETQPQESQTQDVSLNDDSNHGSENSADALLFDADGHVDAQLAAAWIERKLEKYPDPLDLQGKSAEVPWLSMNSHDSVTGSCKRDSA